MSDRRIVDLTREEAIEILLRITQNNLHESETVLVLDGVLTKEECDWILNELHTNNIWDYSKLTNQEYGYTVRGGKSYGISNIKHVDDFIYERVATKIFNELRENVNYGTHFEEGRGIIDLGYDYCRYVGDNILLPHYDGVIIEGEFPDFLNLNVNIDYNPCIFASMSLMLNDLDEGGELCFPKQDITIKQKAGRVVVWGPSENHKHATQPLVEGTERHVIVTWYARSDYIAVKPKDIVAYAEINDES